MCGPFKWRANWGGGGVDMERVDEWARDGGWDVGAECSECETRGSLAQNESPALRHAIQL